MKQTSKATILVAIILCLPMALHAQFNVTVVNANEVLKAEPIDDVLFTVQYETTSLPNTEEPEKTENETMMLKVGRKSSVYYSYAKFLSDSIIEIDKKNGASIDVINNHLKQYSSKINYKVYKNYPAGKLTYLDQIAVNRYVNQEKTVNPQWTLLPDTMTILSYPCQKATCDFYGRTYEAWYTAEISRSDGPWKLQGLPGLILKAQDTEGHYTFECTGIVQNHNEEEKIMYSVDGYEPISRKDLNKMYARFYADPIGYISSSAPNVQVKVMDESGNPMKPKNIPYNPIERK